MNKKEILIEIENCTKSYQEDIEVLNNLIFYRDDNYYIYLFNKEELEKLNYPLNILDESDRDNEVKELEACIIDNNYFYKKIEETEQRDWEDWYINLYHKWIEY